jgi:hypothetical protein
VPIRAAGDGAVSTSAEQESVPERLYTLLQTLVDRFNLQSVFR